MQIQIQKAIVIAFLHLYWVACFWIPTLSLNKWYGMSCNTNMFLNKFWISPYTTWLALKRGESRQQKRNSLNKSTQNKKSRRYFPFLQVCWMSLVQAMGSISDRIYKWSHLSWDQLCLERNENWWSIGYCCCSSRRRFRPNSNFAQNSNSNNALNNHVQIDKFYIKGFIGVLFEPLFAYNKGLFWRGTHTSSWRHFGVQILGTLRHNLQLLQPNRVANEFD